MTQLTDEEIEGLIRERKTLPQDYIKRLKPVKKAHRQHQQAELEVLGDRGSSFKIFVRKNVMRSLDFSVLLVYCPREDGTPVVLRRYNGKHFHRNRLENDELHGFHVHQATERYQIAGLDIDGYAEPSKEYSTPQTALDSLIKDGNFHMEKDTRLNGFGD